MSTTFPIKGDADKKLGAYYAPLSVSAQAVPNMTVAVRAGSFFNSANALVQYPGGSTATITSPVSGAKWVLVTLTDTGSLALVNGTNQSAPTMPDVPVGSLPLAAIYVSSTTTAITGPMIQDVRPFLRATDAVADLAGQLADRPTFTDVANDLALKADVDGTPNTTFTLNKYFPNGSPNADVSLEVLRGSAPTVSIRWNESVDTWEFTNDGVNFSAFVSSIGTFAPLVHTHVASDITNFTPAVNGLVTAAIAGKADTTALQAHVNDTAVHHTLPLPQTAITGLVTDLASKASVSGQVFTGSVAVDNGVNQPIALVSTDPGSSGIQVDRSSLLLPAAKIEWDESSGAWLVGTVGSMNTIATGSGSVQSVNGHTGVVVLTNADVGAAATAHTHVAADIVNFNAAAASVAQPLINATPIGGLADVNVGGAVANDSLVFDGVTWNNRAVNFPQADAASTGNATPTLLTTVSIPMDSARAFNALVTGYEPATGTTYSTRIFAAGKNVGGTVSLVTPVQQDVAADAAAAAWDVVVAVSGSALVIRVVGEAGHLIGWKSNVTIV